MDYVLFFILSVFLLEMTSFGVICLNNFIQEYSEKEDRKKIVYISLYLLVTIVLWYLLIISRPFY